MYRKFSNCVKIFVTGENVVPNFNQCDYAITCHNIKFGDRHLYFNCDFGNIVETLKNARKSITADLAKRKFCNFIYFNCRSGDGTKIRQDFCKRLMEYKHVDCPGKCLNNMKDSIGPRYGNWVETKLDFIKNYKFTIAFENTHSNGYTTEKLVHPFLADSIPIYYGNPEIGNLINSKAFINCNDYKNFDEVIAKVIELDKDDNAYLAMLNEPIFSENCKIDYATTSDYEKFILNIIEKGNNPYYKTKLWQNTENYTIFSTWFNKTRCYILSKITTGNTKSRYIHKHKELLQRYEILKQMKN